MLRAEPNWLAGLYSSISYFFKSWFWFCFLKLNYSERIQVSETRGLVNLIRGAVTLTKRFGDDVIAIHSEDVIQNPIQELKKMCKFLAVTCSQEYLESCASIVYETPSKTRNMIIWNEKAKEIITNIIQEVPYFQKYSLEKWSIQTNLTSLTDLRPVVKSWHNADTGSNFKPIVSLPYLSSNRSLYIITTLK